MGYRLIRVSDWTVEIVLRQERYRWDWLKFENAKDYFNVLSYVT